MTSASSSPRGRPPRPPRRGPGRPRRPRPPRRCRTPRSAARPPCAPPRCPARPPARGATSAATGTPPRGSPSTNGLRSARCVELPGQLAPGLLSVRKTHQHLQAPPRRLSSSRGGRSGAGATHTPAGLLSTFPAGPAKLGDLLEHCLPVSSLFTLLAPFAVSDQPEVARPSRPTADRPRARRRQPGLPHPLRAPRPPGVALRPGQPAGPGDGRRGGRRRPSCRAHAALGRLRDEDRLLPWLLGIARRVCLEHHRRRGPESAGTAEEAEQRSSLSPSDGRDARAAPAG